MADTKIIHVSLDNLKYYDGKLKQYITDADTAVKNSLEGQLDVFGGALDGEIARAKAAEEANATAAQNAQAKGEEALAHSEALADKVGEVPEGSTVMGIITNIQENAYDDTEIRGLISGLDTNKADKTQVATDIETAVNAEAQTRLAADQAFDGRMTDAEGAIENIEKDYLKAADKTELEGKITAEETARIAADDEIKASVKAISDDYLKGADKTELEGKITANTNAIATLNGDGEGSVKKSIDDALNKFATDVTNDDVVNSYKELIDWAAEHGSEAAEMVAAIEVNETAINELETFIGSLPDGATVTTVIAYIEKLVADEKARAEQAESDLSGRLDVVEEMLDGEGSVATQIEDAKQAAIYAAADDATDKANTAEANAKSYADSLNTAMDTRVVAVEAEKHTHSNKALLDTYTQTEADLADAVDKKHEHANKSVLDGIDANTVAAWDASEQNAKDYADGLNGAMDSRVVAVEEFIGNIEFATTADIDGLFD